MKKPYTGFVDVDEVAKPEEHHALSRSKEWLKKELKYGQLHYARGNKAGSRVARGIFKAYK